MKSDTRLFRCHHEGSRTSEDAMELFAMVEQMRSKSSLTPVFTSDDWDPFEEGLLNIYGTLEVPPYKGISRKPLPRLIPPEDLKYVEIEKKKVGEKVVETVKTGVYTLSHKTASIDTFSVGSNKKLIMLTNNSKNFNIKWSILN